MRIIYYHIDGFYFLAEKIESLKFFGFRRTQLLYRNNMRHIDERGYNHRRTRTTRITVAFSVVCPNNHAITSKRITYIIVKYMLYQLDRPTTTAV